MRSWIFTRLNHVMQLLQLRFPKTRGKLSNLFTMFRLSKMEMYFSDIPRVGMLIKLARELNKTLTWSDLFLFLDSKSEINQEFVAYLICGRKGYFVEFGAMDGIEGTNTFLLETVFEWEGILAEALPELAESCSRNRKSPCYNAAVIGNSQVTLFNQENGDDACPELVSQKSKSNMLRRQHEQTVLFASVRDEKRIGLSTISSYVDSDKHSLTRRIGFDIIEVPAITLFSLLSYFNAPRNIDFLSIDTEGSELDILIDFPFQRYSFNFICIEHNHSANESKLEKLLFDNGYQRIMKSLSGGDAFFVPNKAKK